MGYGQGTAGINGTGFQLLIIIFMILFGVTLGQMVAALAPSVQVGVDMSCIHQSWLSDHHLVVSSRLLYFLTLSLVLSLPPSAVLLSRIQP